MLLAMVAYGLVVGSFLNVVVARVPERRSLWRPRSACPACGAAIAWHDNVPVLSFVWLRGHCRACRAPIAWRYPVVEAVTGALFGLAYLRFGLTADLVVAAVLLSALVAVTAIDLEHQLIPDVITLPGILAGLAASLATPRVSVLDAALGAAIAGGVFLIIILASGGGMGGGDMKLGAMLGAFLGWKVALLALFISVLLGGLLAVALLGLGRRKRKDAIPFGPFLAAGGAVGMLWGQEIIRWYLAAFG